MSILGTQLNPRSADFLANAAAMRAVVEDLQAQVAKVAEGGGDDSEDITVHSIARDRAAAWLVEKMGQGYELDAKLWAGLWMIEHPLDGRPR